MAAAVAAMPGFSGWASGRSEWRHGRRETRLDRRIGRSSFDAVSPTDEQSDIGESVTEQVVLKRRQGGREGVLRPAYRGLSNESRIRHRVP